MQTGQAQEHMAEKRHAAKEEAHRHHTHLDPVAACPDHLDDNATCEVHITGGWVHSHITGWRDGQLCSWATLPLVDARLGHIPIACHCGDGGQISGDPPDPPVLTICRAAEGYRQEASVDA